jgi:hypothetical protein
MIFMVDFRLSPGCNSTPGVTFRGAWLGKNSDLAFVLVESPDDAHVATAGQVWSQFGTYQAYPIIDVQQI